MMIQSLLLPALPSGVGLTHLRVYSSVAPDGLRGGSPHVHLACTECYYVEKGHGRVQMLSAQGFEEHHLLPGTLLWFSPGVIHRLINMDGALEIFVVMQNGGLPEAGDFVMTMPPDIISNEAEYFRRASLSAQGEVFAGSLQAAHLRRDLAVEGFIQLRRETEERGLEALIEFYTAALNLVRPKLDDWQTIWRNGTLLSAQQAGTQIDALRSGDLSNLLRAGSTALTPPEDRKFGMCGTLIPYLPEGVTVAARKEKDNGA